MTKRKITDTDRLVARNIKRLRELYGFNRRILEEKSGISYGILDQIESFHKPAGKSIQNRIIEALDCPLSELYKEEQPKKFKEPTTPYLTSRQKRLLDMGEHLSDKEIDEVVNYMMWLLAKKNKNR
jgi:transcriptional regulator with XRE-family HTH domain